MLCYYSTEHDPCVNLALESALFANLAPSAPILLLYCCKSAIIIGRNQNPWQEIQATYAQKHHIPFFRRESGGGTVYHDAGNINFSFILPRSLHSATNNLTIITRALHRLGVKARYTERNDILVGGKKVSGSAFRYKDKCALHHGTLLLHANLTHLRQSLGKEALLSIDGVMVRSRPSSVANISARAKVKLRNLVASLCQVLTDEPYFPPARTTKQAVNFSPLSPALLTHEQRSCFDSSRKQLASWQWRIAKTPPCSLSITKEGCHLQLFIKEGVITDLKLNTPHPQQQKIASICAQRLSDAEMNTELLPDLHALQHTLRKMLDHTDSTYRNLNTILEKLSGLCRL